MGDTEAHLPIRYVQQDDVYSFYALCVVDAKKAALYLLVCLLCSDRASEVIGHIRPRNLGMVSSSVRRRIRRLVLLLGMRLMPEEHQHVHVRKKPDC